MSIELMLQEYIGPSCAGEGSQHRSHATAWSHAKGSAYGVGWLNAPLGGYTAFVDCESAMSDEPTSTNPSFLLPVLSSVGGMSKGFVRRSRFSDRLAEAGITPSVGSKSDSYDNAPAETINWVYNAELIHLRPPLKNA